MREMVSMVVVLALICGLSALVLATLKQATANRIEEQVLTYVQGPALEQVLPGHDNDPIAQRKKFRLPGRELPVTVFPARKDGELVAVALETMGKGYAGDIGVMVGFDMGDDTLTGIGITTMKETPGVGTAVAKHGFTGQFRDHPLQNLQLAANGGSIDAVSGATYSSQGAMEAVRKAADLYTTLQVALREHFRQEQEQGGQVPVITLSP
jgi:electron transport complex protein RnfG